MLFVLTPLSCEIFFQKNKFLNSIGIYFSKACNFIKIETLAQVFSWEFCEISNNSFSSRTPTMAAPAMKTFAKNLND